MSAVDQIGEKAVSAAVIAADDKPIVVLKFGSSVLVSRDSLPEVVTEIYRVVRTGRRVVAVTSAFAGVTDRLLAEAEATGCPHDNINAPAFVAIGEETTAALVALACDRSGLCSIALKAPELGIFASGPPDAATPVSLRSDALQTALAQYDVVVVPGFVGIDEFGRTVLLGRGGSDLTAAFLGHVLQAERVRLVKDVDGVYDSDPAEWPSALRFPRIDWRCAREIAGQLVQPRALDFAAAEHVPIEVGAIGADEATLVGSEPGRASPRVAKRKLRVALAGCGVVGAGVAQRLLRRSDAFELVAVLVRDPTRDRGVAIASEKFTTSFADLLECGADVIVDVLSCGETGAQLSLTALERGIDVVSANKQAVVSAYDDLRETANESGARLLYSAAVGGGAPLLETVRAVVESGAAIAEIEGVFNGTVNFVLELLARGSSFDEALAAARRAGLAEEDPGADLNGLDAVAKLNLLAIAAFGRAPASVDMDVASLDLHCAVRAQRVRLKQVGALRRRGGRIVGEVAFKPAEPGPFADLHGDRNAIRVSTESGGVCSARGRGAGRWPTTESVFADLVDLSARASCA